MLRTYDFYQKKLNIDKNEVDRLYLIIQKFEKGQYSEEEIRSLGSSGLKICICEGKYDVFKKLISPFSYKEEGKIYYKYLLDAITLGMVEFINESPSTLMEHWAKKNQNAKYNAKYNGEEFSPVSVQETSLDAVVLYPTLKEELLNAVYTIDKEKILSIKIGDVLPRAISGMGHPVRSHRDVIFYHEVPMVYAGLDLFNKNIISTANDTAGCFGENGDPYLKYIIDYESLDQYNKLVANAMVEDGVAEYQQKSFVGKGRGLIITLPCSKEETIYSVNERLMELLSKFSKQDMLFGQLTVEDIYERLCSWWFLLNENEQNEAFKILEDGYTSENMLEALKYFKYLNIYYDSKEDKFWESEYYYTKHREYLEEQPEFGSQGLK